MTDPVATTLGLVGCVKSKRSGPAPASELYTSPLFRARRAHVRASCGRWFVLSARHGLVEPEQVLEPYDETLTQASRRQRRRWSQQVLAQLDRVLDDQPPSTVEIHAGAAYVDHGLGQGLRERGFEVVTPVAGLPIGQQLQWYRERARGSRDAAPTTPRPSGPWVGRVTSGKYAPLSNHLATSLGDTVTMSFAEVEEILGAWLPPSARRHRAWWSNGDHVQSAAWQRAGFQVVEVDLRAETVRFGRR